MAADSMEGGDWGDDGKIRSELFRQLQTSN